MQPQRLLRLLREADAKGLRQAPGIGPKLAERIAVELRDDAEKLAGRLAASGVDAKSSEMQPIDPAQELLSALTNLGYPPSRAGRVVDAALAEAPPDSSLEDLIRVALRRLSQ
jgi:Holliday junction DNA helicase RuvA